MGFVGAYLSVCLCVSICVTVCLSVCLSVCGGKICLQTDHLLPAHLALHLFHSETASPVNFTRIVMGPCISPLKRYQCKLLSRAPPSRPRGQ